MWVLEERIGFGEFLRMYRFYAERNPQFAPLLPQRVLNPVKSLRNASRIITVCSMRCLARAQQGHHLRSRPLLHHSTISQLVNAAAN